MKIRITKELIIDALKNEPIQRLQAGCWIRGFRGAEDDDVYDADCPRCAVGAVLAHCVSHLSMVTIASIAATKGDAVSPAVFLTREEIEIRSRSVVVSAPMAALSFFFEGTCHLYAREHRIDSAEDLPDGLMEKVREETIAFVESELFPRDLNIDINGANPAKDIVVVGAT